MSAFRTLSLWLSLLSWVVLTKPTASSAAPSSTGDACATVSSLAAAALAASPNAMPTVPAQLAYECLNSVPLHSKAALKLVDAIEPYLEWQSDIAYLKDPPSDYFYPPLDIFGKLASVKSNLENKVYSNEYEFQADLYQIFALAHDGHFIFYPDILTNAFEWGRKLSLVSISSDGISLPKIFIYEDVTSSPSTASAVNLINGVNASVYVENFAYTASFNQDADAAYNTMFYEKAFEAGGVSTGYFSGGGRVRYIYPGNTTTFTFENGTIITLDNIASVKGNFTGVTDGRSFFQKFAGSATSAKADSSSVASNAVAPITTAPGYPAPVVTSNDSIISGYYLNGYGLSDVAVLSVLAFESESIAEFQAVAQTFLADAVRDGKTKLVIDLSANGGGYILQGYDLFRQLFPNIVQDGYTRFRDSPALLAIAEVFSGSIPSDYDPETASNKIIEEYESVFNYRYDLNLTNQPFTTFDDKFSPHVYMGDNFTNIMRWDLNDPLTTTNSTYGLGIEITGYGSRQNFTQPFQAENIIMLYDGYCASTCTLFSEFMRLQAGVKSIAMGGRPSTGPIQGVGGIKGAEILGWNDIYSYAQLALPKATPEQKAILSRLTKLPIHRSSSNGINVRDNILPDNLNDGLPSQYVVEEADCRLYYTLDMVSDVEKLWGAAATAAWGGGKCVSGGLSKRNTFNEGSPAKKISETKRIVLLERGSSATKDAAWSSRHGRKVIP